MSLPSNKTGICLLQDCGRPVIGGRSYCGLHRARKQRLGTMGEAAPRIKHVVSNVEETLMIGDCLECGRVKVYLRDAGKWIGYACQLQKERIARSVALKRRFGITIEQYELMLREQDGRCAICFREAEGNLAVDHDHACCPGREKTCGNCIRGLLCMNCNTALGRWDDNISILQSAIVYLETRKDL